MDTKLSGLLPYKAGVDEGAFVTSSTPQLSPERRRQKSGWDPKGARVRYRTLLESVLRKGPNASSYDSLHPFVEKLLARLDKREARVLRMQFGVDNGFPKNWQEISRSMGVPVQEARDLSEKALQKLLFILTCRLRAASRN